MEKLFIVPNNDGEAIEIQNVLKTAGLNFLVTKQAWGSSWSNLEPEIKEYIYKFKGIIYGVELQGNALTNQCVNIDHHRYQDDDRTNPLSCLEQIALLIGVELTYTQKAISDRDKGHIRLMRENGYPEDIIQLVGWLDRKAQGITEEQELQSLLICRRIFDEIGIHKVNNLVVTLPHNRCQTVRDIAYNTYNNILLFSPNNEFNYYGQGDICCKLQEQFNGWLSANAATLGHGYAGGYADKSEVLNYFKSLGQKVDKEII